jgi:hypothetical protein
MGVFEEEFASAGELDGGHGVPHCKKLNQSYDNFQQNFQIDKWRNSEALAETHQKSHKYLKVRVAWVRTK